jgi:hypothetical protein
MIGMVEELYLSIGCHGAARRTPKASAIRTNSGQRFAPILHITLPR